MKAQIPFIMRGVPGSVHVELGEVNDPSRWGIDLLFPGWDTSAAVGYPVCVAKVDYSISGYGAAMGWIQLVCSDDGPAGPNEFFIDQAPTHDDLATPYCWLGFAPTFFDAPFRSERRNLRWLAHSFLCFSRTALISKEALAVAGYSWGFEVSNGDVRLRTPSVLKAKHWEAHLGILRNLYPEWHFGEAFSGS